MPDAGPTNILAALPSFAEAMAVARGQHRDYLALSRYYGLDDGNGTILEEIGRSFGLTRERVRQLRNRLKARLKQALLDPQTDEPLAREARRIRRMVESGPLLQSEHDIADALARRYGGALDLRERAAVPLLLETIGMRSYSGRSLGVRERSVYWSSHGRLDLFETRSITGAIAAHLADRPQGTTWFELSVAATRAAGRDASIPETKELARIVTAVEDFGTGRTRTRFDRLPSNACRAYRVLWEEGGPLHFREIASRIRAEYRRLDASALGADALSITKHLSLDERFRPVGRSGRWMLAHWTHVRGESVATLMRELLEERGSPATYEEMWRHLRRMRPDVRRATMSALVHVFPDRFVRLRGGRLALAEWDVDPSELAPKRRARRRRAPSSRITVRSRIATLVREALDGQAGKPIKLRELRKKVGEQGGVSSPTVYWVIASMKDVRKFDVGNVRYVEPVGENDDGEA